MAIVGTKGSETLTNTAFNDYIAGLAGNDVLNIGYQGTASPTLAVAAFGGSGNDTYVLSSGSMVLISDSSGNDTISIPFSSSTFASMVGQSSSFHAIVDSSHYYFEIGGITCGIMNFQGSGKIENIAFTDTTVSFESLWGAIKGINLNSINLSYLGSVAAEKIQSMMDLSGHALNLENMYSSFQTPGWFDGTTYMANKLKATPGMNLSSLSNAFESANFFGSDGEFIHFAQYGQWEDVSPLSTFDADYYYKAKAASFNKVDISKVTDAQALEMKTAINNAGMNAWSHYTQYGTKEGIDGSASFDTSAYMAEKLQQVHQTNPNMTMDQLCDAFAAAGLNAAAHYEAYGKAEGLSLIGVSQVQADPAAGA